jgi:hypothetical protein
MCARELRTRLHGEKMHNIELSLHMGLGCGNACEIVVGGDLGFEYSPPRPPTRGVFPSYGITSGLAARRGY